MMPGLDVLPSSVKNKKNKPGAMIRRLQREREVWLLCVPIVVWIIIFSYVPLYGLIIAFVDYAPGLPILSSPWVGLKWIKMFVSSPDFLMVIRNTLVISGLNLIFGFPAPIILALLFNELKNSWFKKTVQTISYLPNFVSWVVVAGILYQLLGSDGAVNELLLNLQIVSSPVQILGNGKAFWPLITASNIWKDVGFSSIIYLSAIAGIDPELYQVAKLDGANRFRMIWHVTLPGISTTVVVLFILSVGGLLNAGFEQQLLLGNSMTREYHEVIDTYVYKMGIQIGKYSFAASIGLFKNLISFFLVGLTNWIAKRISDISLI